MLLTTQRNRLIWSHISCQCSFHTEVKTPNNLNNPCHISTLRPQKTQRQSKANNSKMEAINNRATNLVHTQPWYTDAKLQLLSGSKFIRLYGYFYLRSLSFIKQLFIHPHGNDKSLRMIVCLGLGPFCPVIFTPLYRVGTMAAWIIQMDAVLHLLHFDNT